MQSKHYFVLLCFSDGHVWPGGLSARAGVWPVHEGLLLTGLLAHDLQFPKVPSPICVYDISHACMLGGWGVGRGSGAVVCVYV